METENMDILVVEDSGPQMLLLSSFIKKIGHKVYTAENGIQALEVLDQHQQIRMVISDWMMPQMDGAELCRTIRRSGSLRYVYFILLTGNIDDESVVKGLNFGADDYVKKPVKFDELKARINAGIRIINLEKTLEERNRDLSQALLMINKDMESAAKMQSELLAKPALIQETEFDWYFKPSKFIGGDMFGYHALDDEHVCFYQLDVAGHGIPSALFSFSLNRLMSDLDGQDSFLKEQTVSRPFYRILDPAEVMEALNRRFQTTTESMLYFTMAYGVLNTASGRVMLTQAGHPPVIHLRENDKKAEKAVVAGLPVGMIPDVKYETQLIELDKGDRLILYSDGIIECENRQAQQYGEKRFEEVLVSQNDKSVPEMVSGIKASVEDWASGHEFEDDVTYLILQWKGRDCN